ncbi:MAG: glycosyltransferase [Candidatus Limnocylindrales bacterium]
MIRTIVLGQPYWGIRISQALHAPEAGLTSAFVGQRGWPGLLLARSTGPTVLLRAGFRVGGTTPRARAFDAYWSLLRRRFPKAAGAHYWLGTDVLNTTEEAVAGTLRRSLVAGSHTDLHLADAPWLVAELAAIGLGIEAQTVHVPQPYPVPAPVEHLPSSFSVLTYLPADRFEFYGGPAVLAAARRLPGVTFLVVGKALEDRASVPANVRFLGWVADMAASYRETSVVLRVPRHDGFGATVIEGLLNARHVIYTHDVPGCRSVWPVTDDSLVAEIGDCFKRHNEGQLATNAEGRAYAIREFSEAALVDRLRSVVREFADGR